MKVRFDGPVARESLAIRLFNGDEYKPIYCEDYSAIFVIYFDEMDDLYNYESFKLTFNYDAGGYAAKIIEMWAGYIQKY